ncbi:twin-arginine translocation signal domain-containing protein [Chamaesiphon sp. OTE_20_metabat_361]|nr:twin-arginine translocation signal domain-containing protein [Chamaesiphon sp. OTE_20_metabat_361]
MDISRRDLLKTTATSGLVAAGFAAYDAIKPLFAKTADRDRPELRASIAWKFSIEQLRRRVPSNR